MKYGFIYSVILYAFGVFIAAYSLNNLFVIAVVITLIAFTIIYIKQKFIPLGIFILFVVFCFGYFNLILYKDMQTATLSQFNDEKISAIATIISPEAKIGEKCITYQARIDKIKFNNMMHQSDEKVIVNIYGNSKKYKYNDVINIYGKISRLQKMNSNIFYDYTTQLETENIFFKINVNEGWSNYIETNNNINSLYDISCVLRSEASQVIDRFMAGDNGAIALSKLLLLADKSNIDNELNKKLEDSGLSFVIKPNGITSSAMLSVLFVLFALLGYNRPKWYIASIIPMLFLILITGVEYSIIRMCIMIFLYLIIEKIAKVAYRPNIIAITVLIISVFNPTYLLTLSFIYSIIAIISIICFNEYFYKKLKIKNTSLRQFTAIWVSVQIALLPIVSLNMQSLVLTTYITNILLLPVMPIVMFFGYFTILLTKISTILAIPFLGLLIIFIKGVLAMAFVFSKLSFAKIYIPNFDLIGIIIYVMSLYILFLNINNQRNSKRFKVSLVILSSFISVAILNSITSYSTLNVNFVDVGQADASIVGLAGGKTVLIDAGGVAETSDYDFGNEFYVPYLLSNGIYSIDTVIVSHYHKDHCQGIIAVLNQLNVKKLILPYMNSSNEYKTEIENIANNKAIDIQYVNVGDNIALNNSTNFKVLYPSTYISKKDENDNSLVAKLIYKNTSFLYTGDISKNIEETLLDTKDISSTVLKVAHHGAAASASVPFYKAVHPKYSVISVGKNNYGHPSDLVIQDLAKLGSCVYRTDLNGNVSFRVYKNGNLSVKTSK